MMSAPDFKAKLLLIVFLSRGEKMNFRNDNIIVTDSEGKIKHQSTCWRIFTLFIVGNMSITSGLLAKAERFSFYIIFMTHSLKPYGMWGSENKGNFLLRKKQYHYTGMDIAQHLILNKIQNQMHTLQRIRSKDEKTQQAIRHLHTYENEIHACPQPCDMQKLLGFEGSASRSYFQALFSEQQWKSRKPRTKHDITNVLLDRGYTFLFNFIEALLQGYGFDIYQGVYHRLFYQRKSLVCDLVEPFRPLIDWRIRKAYRLGQIQQEDFTYRNYQYYLNTSENKRYTAWILEPLITHKEEIFLYIQQYYRCFMRGKPIQEYPQFKISH